MEMNKTRQQYEQETDKEAIVFSPKGVNPSNGYAVWLEEKVEEMSAKATAYDRLMSGGKKTPKEVANFLGKPVAVDAEGRLWWFPKKPEIGLVTWIWYDGHFGCFGEELPKNLIDYTGDWKDSLTMPDGWEEKK